MANDYLLVCSAQATALASATTVYEPVVGFITTSATEGTVQSVARASYTVKNLFVFVTVNSLTAGPGTIGSRKNTANGALTVSLTAGVTGTFEDTTHSDSLVATDLYNLFWTNPAAKTVTLSMLSVLLETASLQTPAWVAGHTGAAAVGFGTTQYAVLTGNPLLSTTEADVAVPLQNPTTLTNLRIGVKTNTVDTATTVVFRKNGVGGNLTKSITALTTGSFEDTTNTDSAVPGDLVNVRFVLTGTTGTFAPSVTSVKATTLGHLLFTNGAALAQATAVNFGTTSNFCIAGPLQVAASEANSQLKTRIAAGFSQLQYQIKTNTVNGASTMALRRNAVSTAVIVSINSTTTGTFSDLVDSITTLTTDLLNFRTVTTGSSGTLGHIWASIVQLQTAGAPSSSETGTEAESLSLSAAASISEASSSTETPALVAASTTSDSGTQADALTLATALSETGSASETPGLTAASAGTDSHSLTDQPALSTTLTQTETSSSTESLSLSASGSDLATASLGETLALSAAVDLAEASSALEGLDLAPVLTNLATGSITETTELALVISEDGTSAETTDIVSVGTGVDVADTESFACAEDQALQAALSETATGSQADVIVAQINSLATSDLASAGEAGALALAISESGLGSTTQSLALTSTESATSTEVLAVALTQTEAGTSLETPAVDVAFSDTAAATTSELASLAAALTGTELASSAEQLTLALGSTESASSTERGQTSLLVITSDALTSTEAGSLAVALTGIETRSSTESVVVSASLSASDLASQEDGAAVLSVPIAASDAATETEQTDRGVSASARELGQSTEQASLTVALLDQELTGSSEQVGSALGDLDVVLQGEQLALALAKSDSRTSQVSVALAVAASDTSDLSEANHVAVPVGDTLAITTSEDGQIIPIVPDEAFCAESSSISVATSVQELFSNLDLAGQQIDLQKNENPYPPLLQVNESLLLPTPGEIEWVDPGDLWRGRPTLLARWSTLTVAQLALLESFGAGPFHRVTLTVRSTRGPEEWNTVYLALMDDPVVDVRGDVYAFGVAVSFRKLTIQRTVWLERVPVFA